MEKTFNIMQQTRSNFLALVDGLSLEQLNTIPEGCSNNIAWNFGHIIVTQQLLCYTVSGFEPKISQSLIDKYRKGTKLEGDISEEELEQLKQFSVSLFEVLVKDYNGGFFTSYKTYPTSYGVELNSIEDAIQFLTVHEGLHLGYAMALRKLV